MAITLGRHSYIHDNDYVNTFQAKVHVGNFTSIAKRCVFVGGGAQHASALNRNLVSNFPFLEHLGWSWPGCGARGDIFIGSDAWLGANVTVMDNVTIGDGAIIGAGSVVPKCVPPYAVMAGNPIRLLRYRFNATTIEKLLKIKWWEWPDEKICANLEYMQDVDAFVDRFGGDTNG